MHVEVGNAVKVDSILEQTCHDNDSLRNTYHDLFFLQAQVDMAKNDTTGLVIDLPNKLVYVQIKGVNVFQTKIQKQELDFMLRDIGFHAYRYLHEKPLKIQAEHANIEREPIVHITAPADTAAARLAPKHQPDTTLIARIKLDYQLEKNINLTIAGYEPPSTSACLSGQSQFIHERLKLTKKMIVGIFTNQPPEHRYHIHLWVKNHDARIMYRALLKNSRVVIRT